MSTIDAYKRDALVEYFGNNARGLQDYLNAKMRDPIVVGGQPAFIDMSDETHEILANTAGWFDTRELLDDSARVIQEKWRVWRDSRMEKELSNMMSRVTF